MPKVVAQDPSVTKRKTCRQCGAVNEYTPNEERELRRGADYDGGRYVQYGFNCGQCGAEIVTKEW